MSGEELFLCLGGQWISNCVTQQRVSEGFGPEGTQCRDCDPCCGDMLEALGYPGGIGTAQLPWYDANQPDSWDIAGLLVTSVTGLGPGDMSRTVTDLAREGAQLGTLRQAAPVIVVTGVVLAATCCGQDYFMKWLRQWLRGDCKTANCRGEELTFLACSPKFLDQDCADPDAIAACLAQAVTPERIAECNAMADIGTLEEQLKPYYRTMKGVALTDGPRIISRIPRGCPECRDCCPMYEVQFTLSASRPCVYHDPTILLDKTSFTCTEDDECIEWASDLNNPDVDCEDCPEAADCGIDPLCAPTAPPPAPPLIVNPCAEDCVTLDTCQVCVDVPNGTFPSVGEGTLNITIDNSGSGSVPLRNIKVKVWQNPLGLDAELLEDCDLCSELTVSYVAPGSILTIDGENRRATISCVGGREVRANPFISSGGSPLFSYPSMDGCGDYTVCIEVASPAGDAAVTIEAVGVEC